MDEEFAIERFWDKALCVVVGGGPSLTLDQVRTLAFARLTGRCFVIAVNDAIYPCWFADWLHAADFQWWQWNIHAVQHFQGLRTTICDMAPLDWARRLKVTGVMGFDPDPSCCRTGNNSGYQAVHSAIHAGANRIVLLGLDMSRGHWFEDERSPDYDLGETAAHHFASLVSPAVERGVQIFNASPASKLNTLFPPCDLRSLMQ